LCSTICSTVPWVNTSCVDGRSGAAQSHELLRVSHPATKSTTHVIVAKFANFILYLVRLFHHVKPPLRLLVLGNLFPLASAHEPCSEDRHHKSANGVQPEFDSDHRSPIAHFFRRSRMIQTAASPTTAAQTKAMI